VKQAQTEMAAINDHAGRVGVHLLMGGADAGDWHLHPERAAILIGTQDMLLSRALNRGYGSARARWPMDFGLLNRSLISLLPNFSFFEHCISPKTARRCRNSAFEKQ